MRTNKEKYDYYLGKINELESAYLKSVFPDGIPPHIYSLGKYKITKENVCGVLSISKFYEKERPSRVDVEKAKAFSQNPTFRTDDIYIECESFEDNPWGVSRSSWAHKYNDILSGRCLSFSPWELRKQLRENRARYTIKEGQISCDYCGKAVNRSEVVERKIISIATYGRQGKLGRYCKWECGSYDQMAHEG